MGPRCAGASPKSTWPILSWYVPNRWRKSGLGLRFARIAFFLRRARIAGVAFFRRCAWITGTTTLFRCCARIAGVALLFRRCTRITGATTLFRCCARITGVALLFRRCAWIAGATAFFRCCARIGIAGFFGTAAFGRATGISHRQRGGGSHRQKGRNRNGFFVQHSSSPLICCDCFNSVARPILFPGLPTF